MCSQYTSTSTLRLSITTTPHLHRPPVTAHRPPNNYSDTLCRQVRNHYRPAWPGEDRCSPCVVVRGRGLAYVGSTCERHNYRRAMSTWRPIYADLHPSLQSLPAARHLARRLPISLFTLSRVDLVFCQSPISIDTLTKYVKHYIRPRGSI